METNNFDKDYKWVTKILESSETVDHLKSSKVLIELFLKKWSKEVSDDRLLRIKYRFDSKMWLQSWKIKKIVV
jgi:hypothetical protein